ncbi:MAG: hypothetical protein K6F93_01110 [Lachnospiraceae bacterium]|nr:hypothetical protein [Lachnospiraceae bacterium]
MIVLEQIIKSGKGGVERMKNKALKTVGIVLMILSTGFICFRLAKLDYSSVDIDLSLSTVLILLLSLILSTIAVPALGLIFALNVGKGKDGKRLPMKKAVYVYCRANLGKYIPGNVFQYIERNLFFSSYGISHTDTALASVIEVASLIIGAVILSVIFGNFSVIVGVLESYTYLIPVACGLIVLVIVVIALIFHRKKRSFGNIIKRFKERGGVKLLIFNVAAYTLILLIMGVSVVVAGSAVTTASAGAQPSGLLGAYIAAWLCGFIVIGAPGGIGVREAVFSLIYYNTPYLDSVLALSILVRVISILADVISYIVSRLSVGKIMTENDNLQ